ncbi:MAG: molybdopterin oxidoreductase, partial [Candidatus Dadabacteria bacterium]
PRCEDYTLKWDHALKRRGIDPSAFPFYLINTRSMHFAWGSNTSLPVMSEMAQYVTGFGGVVINASAAARLGISDGDRVVIESPLKKKTATAILREGIRPDTAVLTGQFGNWAMPFAKDLGIPSINELIEPDQELFDAGGSSCDLVKVRIYKA